MENDGAFLRENARHSTPTVTWVGHATLLVQMEHVSFLTDPTWSDTASAVSFARPERFIPPIDFVGISHNHYDHLDLDTLEALATLGSQTRFFVPEGSHLNPEEAWQASLDLRARCAVAMHYETFDLSDEPVDEPPRRFVEAARASSRAEEASRVLDIGETRPF